MSESTVVAELRADAATERSSSVRSRADRPSQRRMFADDGGQRGTVRALLQRAAAGTVALDWADAHVFGLASRTEWGYEMHDCFGPYTEVVSLDAFDVTLAADPLVEFTLNHNRSGGPPMAHTRNATLVLSVVKEGDETGLTWDASVDPTRSDVANMLKAYERGDMAEASFKFSIVRGLWSPDYTEYRIFEVDLDGGDVSSVNFGASPGAWSQARSKDEVVTPAPAVLRHLPNIRVVQGI